VVRWLVDQHRRDTQEIIVAMSLEPSAAMPALRALQGKIAAQRAEIGFGGFFVETPLNLYLAWYGSQRRVDALRAVEAIRHYAATHDGKLPESLDQITETPVPGDVLTGKPFSFERAGEAAILSAPGVPVERGQLAAVRYRITLQEAKPAPATK